MNLENNITDLLSERQKEILRSIVSLYILNATPVGSRKLSKFLDEKQGLSAATLRNVMADLEELDYIHQTHTSAGRIPTDKGYRFYVDSLNLYENLSFPELKLLNNLTDKINSEELLKKASKILSNISHYLSIVRIPQIRNLIVLKIELIPINSSRILFVLALDSNIVRTLTIEANIEINFSLLSDLSQFINEKVSGKSLSFIRENFEEIISEYSNSDSSLIRIFIDSVDTIFQNHNDGDKIYTSGTINLLNHPEFEDIKKFRSIIELIEDKDIIIHLLDNSILNDKTKVVIGTESGNDLFEDYSIVMSKYQIGSANGSIGVIGPKRMNYSKMIALVDAAGKLLINA